MWIAHFANPYAHEHSTHHVLELLARARDLQLPQDDAREGHRPQKVEEFVER